MGSPLADKPSDIDTGGIFFFIPFYLAKRKLIQKDIFAALRSELYTLIVDGRDPKRRQEAINQFNQDVIVLGRMFFTWERSILCPICLHWWLTVILMLLAWVFGWNVFFEFPLQTIFVYLVNHFFIRKIA
jgi:hypothetical protein